MRADELLVKQGLAESRSQARRMILEGNVTDDDGRPVDKPSKKMDASEGLKLLKPQPFVSRAGEKLEAFLLRFDLETKEKSILDLGASTGGFTDCLLQRGASRAVCIDVGHGQLHQRISEDPRVTNIEKTNARSLEADQLPVSQFGIVVMDLSFISLKLVIEKAWMFVEAGGYLIALIKPQFEATKAEIDAGKGVIKNEKIHKRIRAELEIFCSKNLIGSELVGLIDSPIKGGDGNREFLIGFRKCK